jgi:hypothetical protein
MVLRELVSIESISSWYTSTCKRLLSSCVSRRASSCPALCLGVFVSASWSIRSGSAIKREEAVQLSAATCKGLSALEFLPTHVPLNGFLPNCQVDPYSCPKPRRGYKKVGSTHIIIVGLQRHHRLHHPPQPTQTPQDRTKKPWAPATSSASTTTAASS